MVYYKATRSLRGIQRYGLSETWFPAFWNICSQRKIIRQPADFRRLPPSNGKTAHVDVMMTRKLRLNLYTVAWKRFSSSLSSSTLTTTITCFFLVAIDTVFTIAFKQSLIYYRCLSLSQNLFLTWVWRDWIFSILTWNIFQAYNKTKLRNRWDIFYHQSKSFLVDQNLEPVTWFSISKVQSEFISAF